MRTHNGEKPFECEICKLRFTREHHLNAHSRTHKSEDEKPFSCDICHKKFWTNQHLQRHLKTHTSSCICEICNKGFPKQFQLRNHMAEEHHPSGTLPFICTHPGCDKSFVSKPKLDRHARVHQSDRYSCGHPECLHLTFSKWTELQAHIKQSHKATCPYPDCRKVFSDRHNLNSHLKLHEQREIEKQIGIEDESAKIRGGIIGRDYKCEVEGCDKAFKSQKSLNVHVNTTHLNIRPFQCDSCEKAFGHKHLLARHMKVHKKEEETVDKTEDKMTVEEFTGVAYQKRTISCPYLKILELDNLPHCPFKYTRRYDLRRHLKAQHGIDFTKQELNYWLDGHVEEDSEEGGDDEVPETHEDIIE
ncbi:hypothetical protein WALSEDRAFT_59155 [Wallemia mellicola CBS 633.66]|uniref:C2H2-type domain-containing protein n=1 Tax=Wallemia mellicola (strain ATCC MYA-4683 / CBS 633.66) TaxID=671144 RepID=I4YJT5_WALMC|nr:hypothetical protein WALSEDRAFT_59155 [Wallemia mellicola CBS 633.66]EIM24227.1 hypothetical protein WALSEDRAFT_59155 [Wallemia mellicola CBS 633.66]|eukprot:XP_006956045.1 hypothetical protein WALSEDRAFT_59155 [Wallemia mellicola CBS 633.66]